MKKRTRLLIILLLALTAAVIIYALFFMGQGVETSHVALPTPGESGGVEATPAPGYDLAELTAENVQSVLAELNRAESYSCTVTIEDFWDGGSSTSELQVWVSGGRTRIRSAIGGSTRNVLVSDGMLYIWSDSISGVYAEPYSGGADAWMRSITYEDVLDVPVENILSAGYQQYSGIDCIHCRYTDPETGYINVIYVAVGSGLLMGAETCDGSLIYRMDATTFELGSPDESLFEAPES
ncbi:MAG: hypothetical protein ACLUGW_10635 [Oscillospiraceae bacterium]